MDFRVTWSKEEWSLNSDRVVLRLLGRDEVWLENVIRVLARSLISFLPATGACGSLYSATDFSIGLVEEDMRGNVWICS